MNRRYVVALSMLLALSPILTEAQDSNLGGNPSFDQVVDTTQLRGCWKRVIYPEEVKKRLQKIELYPFDEPENQWFCFLENDELFTLLSTKPEERTLESLMKASKIFPIVERYSLIKRGLVLIHHLDTDQKILWVTSVAVVPDSEEVGNIENGDLLMTIRNFETGEDLYYRQLRRVK